MYSKYTNLIFIHGRIIQFMFSYDNFNIIIILLLHNLNNISIKIFLFIIYNHSTTG